MAVSGALLCSVGSVLQRVLHKLLISNRFKWPLRTPNVGASCSVGRSHHLSDYKSTGLSGNLLLRNLAVTESGRHVESKLCGQFTPDL